VRDRRTALVVGAGLAGLTAAFRLARGGADVIVGCYTHYFTLLDDVGLSGELVPVTAPAPTIRGGRIVTFQDHHKCSDRAPSGHSLLSIHLGDRANVRCRDRSDEDLTEWACAKAENQLKALSPAGSA
jgi:FAD binding domain